MGFLAKLGSLFRKQEAELTPEEKAALEAVKAQIRERCRRFRSLLSANKRALETMSEMEEHLEGARPFGAEYVRAAGTRAATAVFQMIREINGLTKNAYPELNGAFARISARIEAATAPKAHPAEGPLVLPLEQISLADIREVGGKMANLGEVASGAGLPVPPGFAVTVSAYRLFLKENGLAAEIEKRIRATDMDSLDQVFQLSAGLQQAVQAAPLPAMLEDAIWNHLEILVDRYPAEDLRLSLRSSAVGEDALGASFAGQYRTELNVHPDEVTSIWKEIVASKYTVAALSYRYQRGIPDEDAPMCVGVLKMVDAEAGGVAYSTDPVGAKGPSGEDLVVLNAVPGLPAAVVDGGVTPDTWAFTRSHPAAFASRRIAFKASRLDIDPASAMGMRVTRFSQEEGLKPSLTDEQAQEVAQIALGLEEYYAEPQDVEWAIEKGPDGRRRVIVLQSRPLQEAGRNAAGGEAEAGAQGQGEARPGEASAAQAGGQTGCQTGVQAGPLTGAQAEPQDASAGASGAPAAPAASAPERGADAVPDASPDQHAAPAGMLCQGGVGVSRGTAVGPVFIARRDADMLSFPEGAILVVERAFPRWAPLLPRAAGMVSEAGGMAGHLASVCREYRVPAVFGLKDACKLLKQGEEVTLDAGACRILRGAHPEIGQASQGLPKLMAGSPVMKMLEQVAECIVPLHLLDPKSPDFAPEKCTTLHDLTRFCHEKSADFMFSGDAGVSERMGKQLKAGAKLQYWVVDMDRGFTRDVQGPVVDIKEIASTPMLALWDGLVAVPWAGPPMAASGLMSVVFESAMNPELEVTAANTMAERNYFIVDADYMLLQARYGYHFCTVEALAGEEAQENFVSFQFKGGAADVARRKLRTRLIADVLLPWGFNCDVKGDSLFAVAEGFAAEETLLRTKLVGYLLLHTRQSDVIMADDGQREAFREKLEGDMKDIAEGRAGKKR